MIIAATANPRITSVSGIATIRIARPVSSGFSAIAAIAAAPIRACAKPVPSAPRPTATPAPSAISPSFTSSSFFRGFSHLRLRTCPKGPERLAAALVELAEELDVVKTDRLDHRAERRERQVERVEERRDQHTDPEGNDQRQLVRDCGEVCRCEADGGKAQVREDVAERPNELEWPHHQAQRTAAGDEEHDADGDPGAGGRGRQHPAWGAAGGNAGEREDTEHC